VIADFWASQSEFALDLTPALDRAKEQGQDGDGSRGGAGLDLIAKLQATLVGRGEVNED